MDAEFPANPPPGFVHSKTRGPYTTHNGPYFHKVEDDGRFWHGLRVQRRHRNAFGSLRGGMMSAFADGLLATAISRAPGRDGTARLVGEECGMAFAEAEAHANGNPVFTASGVFRTFPRK